MSWDSCLPNLGLGVGPSAAPESEHRLVSPNPIPPPLHYNFIKIKVTFSSPSINCQGKVPLQSQFHIQASQLKPSDSIVRMMGMTLHMNMMYYCIIG